MAEHQTPEGEVWKFVDGGQVIDSANWDWDAATSSYDNTLVAEVGVSHDENGHYWADHPLYSSHMALRAEGLPVYTNDATDADYQYDAVTNTLTPLVSGYAKEPLDYNSMPPTDPSVEPGWQLVEASYQGPGFEMVVSIYEETSTGTLYSFTSSEYDGTTTYTAQNEVRSATIPDGANALPAGDLSGYSAPDLDALRLTPDDINTSFTTSLTLPSGIDFVLTGDSEAAFSASMQVNDIYVSETTVDALVDAAAGTSQVTDVVVPSDDIRTAAAGMETSDTVGDTYSVKVGSTNFTHTLTQSDLDAADPVASVISSLEALIDADTSLGVTAEAVSSTSSPFGIEYVHNHSFTGTYPNMDTNPVSYTHLTLPTKA